MQEDTTTEVKEVIIGDFKPKRKFLSFISAVNGARVRFNRDIAFVKGEKLSGTLEGVIFKITICDEGTINFDEIDTNVTDKAQRQRLIDDIDALDVTGYAQKFVIGTIQFDDIDGRLCYLEVEHQKPIDVLRSIFGDDEQEEVKQEVELSERGMSLLDDLFGSSDEVETLELSERDAEILIDAIENPAEPNEKLKKASESYLEEQFRKMNEEKVNELKSRITDTTKEIINHKREISQAESKLKLSSEQLGVLETRLESMTPGDEPNGYVFFVSEEQKNELGLDESTKHVADKIADLLGLKKDVLFEQLTGGFYKIRIAKKDDITAEKVEVTKEILEKMSFDPMGKMSMETPGEFEYRGDLNWHQLVGKMIRNGFEQEPEFDKLCNSNSYDSKEEEKTGSLTEAIQEVNKDMLIKIEELKKETKNTSLEIKSKDLRTYNEETTLVVMGTIDHNEDRDVEITDDYTSFEVYVGDKKVKGFYESDGFISIMTLPDFKKWQTQNPDAMSDGGGVDSFLLPDFKGTIGVTAMYDVGEFTNDFDLSDYIQHQIEDACVSLTLPEGTEIIKMDNYHQVPVATMRDIKINKLINNDVNKILTKEQLETVEQIKKSGIDITKNWFIFDTQSDEFAESEDFKFWVTIQLEEGDDQDPMCEEFLPESIKNNLHNYAEVVFGYDGDLSEEEFIKELDKSNFFTYKK
jgi:hypothetical protein